MFALNTLSMKAGQPDLYNSDVFILSPRFVYIFYFIEVAGGDGDTPLVIDSSYYSTYDSFISSGNVPSPDEDITVSDATATVRVRKTVDELRVDFSIVNRPLPTVVNPFYIKGSVEVWSRFLNADGKVPANRYIRKANHDNSEINLIQSGFFFSGGNPGNRTYAGILQPNGFYKSQFLVNLPYASSASYSGTANQYFEAYARPYSVPDAPSFISP